MRENSGVMTPEEKAAAIERARDNAETAAKAVGQSVEQVQAAGEAAAVAAQRLLEERQPQ
ncbi:Antifreeze protein, type I [Brucella sp. BO2]|nr:Antifreeze protein, type I [Brucella sp. BO2]